MHVVRPIKHERPSLQQMAKWRNRPGAVHWGHHVVLPSGSRFHGRFSLLLCHSCAKYLAHAFVCSLSPVFLDRHCVISLLVWCCHRDSLTRWRLANCARSRACSLFSQSSRLVPAHDDMCLVVSDTRKVSSRYVEIWRSCIHR